MCLMDWQGLSNLLGFLAISYVGFPSEENHLRKEKAIIRNLNNDEYITILAADKEFAAMVMNISNYK